MKRLIVTLEEYGADTKGTMERFLDDMELYEMCLDAFVCDEGFDGLEAALQQKSYEEAFIHAHTLKGVSANLGLTPLFQVVSTLSEQLRQKDYANIEESYQSVQEARAVVQSLLANQEV